MHVHACPLHVGLFVWWVSATTLESPLPLYHTMQFGHHNNDQQSPYSTLPLLLPPRHTHIHGGGAVGFPLCKRTKFVSCRVLYSNNNNNNSNNNNNKLRQRCILHDCGEVLISCNQSLPRHGVYCFIDL